MKAQNSSVSLSPSLSLSLFTPKDRTFENSLTRYEQGVLGKFPFERYYHSGKDVEMFEYFGRINDDRVVSYHIGFGYRR